MVMHSNRGPVAQADQQHGTKRHRMFAAQFTVSTLMPVCWHLHSTVIKISTHRHPTCHILKGRRPPNRYHVHHELSMLNGRWERCGT